MARWQFFDPTTSESYTFEYSPSEGGTPDLVKKINYTTTTAPDPDSRVLMFEGRSEARVGTFSGTILTQAHYDALVYWYEKRHQIEMTDDLGRTMVVYLTKFSPKRERAVNRPWKHKYAMDYTIIDWV